MFPKELSKFMQSTSFSYDTIETKCTITMSMKTS